MRPWIKVAALVSAPLILIALVFQAGRYASQAAVARGLEAEQRAWIDENRKLQGGIAVLESRERAADLAGKLGLVRASADKRIFITTPMQLAPSSAANPASSSKGRKDG